jgi:VanZ family protein
MSKKSVKNGVVNDYQLALISKSVFDLGPRTRLLMLMFGVVGVVLAFVLSLESGKSVPLDKMIHFFGYFVLSLTFVLALRPQIFIPSLLGLVAMSVAIEFLQKYTGRSFDLKDMVANSVGVASGGLVGLTARGIYAYVRKELAARNVRSRLFFFKAGTVLIREGEPIDAMYIVKSGKVQASRKVNGREVSMNSLGTGEVLGIFGVVEGRPQYATLTAIEPTTLYRMTLPELMESAGGDELPVSLVLTGLCGMVREMADQMVKSGQNLPLDGTLAQRT